MYHPAPPFTTFYHPGCHLERQSAPPTRQYKGSEGSKGSTLKPPPTTSIPASPAPEFLRCALERSLQLEFWLWESWSTALDRDQVSSPATASFAACHVGHHNSRLESGSCRGCARKRHRDVPHRIAAVRINPTRSAGRNPFAKPKAAPTSTTKSGLHATRVEHPTAHCNRKAPAQQQQKTMSDGAL